MALASARRVSRCRRTTTIAGPRLKQFPCAALTTVRASDADVPVGACNARRVICDAPNLVVVLCTSAHHARPLALVRIGAAASAASTAVAGGGPYPGGGAAAP